jgi:5'(3')-deoxyribonucleotidase
MISRVLLDLDDVCNTFTMSALYYVRATQLTMPYTYYPDTGWDIVAAANKLRPKHTAAYTNRTFWDALGRQFWGSIPAAWYCRKLVDVLAEQVGRENVFIATSATLSPDCLAGKLDWIYSNLPKWMHRSYMMGTHKHLMANSQTLLIDDRMDNCERFEREGGHAMLVARPWNKGWTGHPSDAEASLYNGFKHYFGVSLAI